MKNRLSIKFCQKNFLTKKKYEGLGKYSSISYMWESQDASSLAYARCGGNNSMLKILRHIIVFIWSSISNNDHIIIVLKKWDSAQDCVAEIELVIDVIPKRRLEASALMVCSRVRSAEVEERVSSLLDSKPFILEIWIHLWVCVREFY